MQKKKRKQNKRKDTCNSCRCLVLLQFLNNLNFRCAFTTHRMNFLALVYHKCHNTLHIWLELKLKLEKFYCCCMDFGSTIICRVFLSLSWIMTSYRTHTNTHYCKLLQNVDLHRMLYCSCMLHVCCVWCEYVVKHVCSIVSSSS